MANGTSGGMRALKIATIAMGVLIVLGTTVILVTIVKRTMWEPGSSGPTGSAGQPFAAVLDEPAGTGIVSIAQVRERLAPWLARSRSHVSETDGCTRYHYNSLRHLSFVPISDSPVRGTQAGLAYGLSTSCPDSISASFAA